MDTISAVPGSIEHIIEQIRPYLPSQGPLDVFIHHNTLHAFENFEFEAALEAAGECYDAEPYITEARAFSEFSKGRITYKAIQSVIEEQFPLLKRQSIISAERLLLTPLELISNEELKWFLKSELGSENNDTDLSLTDFYPKAIKSSLHEGWLKSFELARQLNKIRPNWIVEKSAVLELPLEVRTLLIKICASYLDRGLAAWELPDRKNGLLSAFNSLLLNSRIILPVWLKSQIKELSQLLSSQTALEIIEIELKDIQSERQFEYLKRKVFKLRGWAGTFATLEANPAALREDLPVHPTLKEFVALLLLLERIYLQYSPEDRIKISSSVSQLSSVAWYFRRLANDNPELKLMPLKEQTLLVSLVSDLDSLRRRRIWHLAYEKVLENKFTSALILHKPEGTESPKYQVICCIDDREGSFRRYIEELGDKYMTFGAAGFFGIDALVRALHKNPAPYCPVAVAPSHEITEELANDSNKTSSELISRFRVKLGHIPHRFFRSWAAAFLGVFSFAPLLVGVIFPQIFGNIAAKRRKLREQSELKVFNPGSEELGYTASEAADRLEKLFKTIGVIKKFGSFVIFVGHGSHSRNNPFRSAYDCGACGGRPGRFNARAAALLANKKEVRQELARREIVIPEQTRFIGSYHNTATDELEWYDLNDLNADQRLEFSLVQKELAQAATKNAEERCRRFRYRSIKSVASSELEVLFRSESIAEPRPEYGHATNAFCIVGKRDLTKGLFLDRRAFLVSYDGQDDQIGVNLKDLLNAIVPVCAGICLEYFFSTLDNHQYGAGTKLPHNVVSLMGVMNGFSGDLRTGLPAQMVEIHEPVRLTMVIQCNREQLHYSLDQLPSVKRLFDNKWITLFRIENSQLWKVSGKEETLLSATEVLPKVESWDSWYVGQSGSLDICELDKKFDV